MAIINCSECGKVCVASPSGQCAACCQRTRQAEVKVAEYLEDHQNSSLEEIHRATSVPRHIIMQMIRKGYITEGVVSYPCESCRQPIGKGRLCPSCAEQVLKFLEPSERVAPEANPQHADMYSRRVTLKRSQSFYQSIS